MIADLLLACKTGGYQQPSLTSLFVFLTLCLPPTARTLVRFPFVSPVVDDGVPCGLIDRPLEARQEVGRRGTQLQPLSEAVAFTVAAASGRAPRLCESWNGRL